MISLKSSFILLFAVTFSHISCQFLGLEKENSETYFFDFDELHHYRIEIDERDLYSKEGQENLTKREQLLIDLLSYEKPQTMTDTAFINQLTDIGFHLKKVDKMEFNMINNLFKEKTERESWEYACEPIFRDVLIFRKNNKVIGMAKICFGCNQSKIIGSAANTANFGQGNDYAKLEEILKN